MDANEIADSDVGIDAADIADRGQFSIIGINGILSFRSPPNYEKPKDIEEAGVTGAVANDNQYRVAVKAVASDPVTDPATEVTITTVYRKITVIVTNVNEDPVFSEEEFTLRIKENADDLHKEPTTERGPLYLVNRGVGIPGVRLPAAPNLDVGTPVVAGDDDNTGTTPAAGDHIDGLIYELMGSADALEAFAIVPATGQILSKKKLDHESKSTTYEVKVTATDPWNAYDTIDLTIEVTNEEEQPIPITVQIAGESSLSYEENGTDDLGDYTATGTGTDATPALSHGGDDKDYFTLTGTGATKTLKFKAAPDYENPRGAEMSDTNTNTYTVAVMGTVKDKDGNDVTGTKTVTITVTNVDELGTLRGEASASTMEGGTDTGETYTLSGGDGTSAVRWMLDGVDASQFRLDGTSMTKGLEFRSAPDYEMPADADTNNIYMVTVKAEAGGEMEMLEVNVTITDVIELGTLAGNASLTPAEGGTDTGGTYTVSGGDGSTVSWMLNGADASQFRLDGTSMTKGLEFRSAPDYEMPADADTNNIYLVTVKAEAGGEIQMVEVTVMVTDVDELGALSGPGSFTQAEGGTDAMETYTLSGGDGTTTVSWTLAGADASQFTLDGTGMSRMLMFESAPDYEMPADADTNNTYMVTVKAEAGGEIQMVEVTVTVTDEDELGALSGPGSFTQAEGGTDAMETYTLSGGDGTSTVSWMLDGADASQFTLDGTGMSRMLMFESAPDYEMPRGQAMSDTNTNTYMVTVKAEAGSEMQMVEVTVTVTDVKRRPGSVTLTPGAAQRGWQSGNNRNPGPTMTWLALPNPGSGPSMRRLR